MIEMGSMPEYPQRVIRARARLVVELQGRMPRASRDQCGAVADWLIGRGFLTPSFFGWGATPYAVPGDRDANPDVHNSQIGGNGK